MCLTNKEHFFQIYLQYSLLLYHECKFLGLIKVLTLEMSSNIFAFWNTRQDKASPPCAYPCQNPAGACFCLHIYSSEMKLWRGPCYRHDAEMRKFLSSWIFLVTRYSLLSRPFLYTISLLLTENGIALSKILYFICTR